jgi:hypothetical protein
MSGEIVVKHTLEMQLELQTKLFDFYNRRAKMLATSNLVPKNYRTFIEVKKGNQTTWEENQSAIANCIIAMEIAQRVGVSDLEVMQNLHIIEGRPSWSSQWLISAINTSGKYSQDLEYETEQLGKKEVTYTETVWDNGSKRVNKKTITLDNVRCRAWSISSKTGNRVEGPWVSLEMAIQEGWYQKNGSKWQTMPEIMLQYRAASFFAGTRCPEVKQGLRTKEEEEDILEASPNSEGTFVVQEEAVKETSSEKLKSRLKKTKTEKIMEESEIVVNPDDLAVDTQEQDNIPPVPDDYIIIDAEHHDSVVDSPTISASSDNDSDFSFE